MSYRTKYNTAATRFSLVAALLCYAVYTFPFFRNFTLAKEITGSLIDTADGLYHPLLRSLIFSVATAILLISLSLAIASALRPVSLTGKKGKWMSLLLLPIILGNVSTSFIWKLLLLDTSLPFSGAAAKFVTLTLIQFWQYGTLYVYLFWINEQLISPNTQVYAEVVGLNRLEQLRDVLLPRQRNISLLLYIIGMITFYYEDAKVQFIFRASRGTNTELVNQWLYRVYQSDSLLSPDFAFRHISQLGLFVLIVGLAGLLVSLVIKDKIYLAGITNRLALPGWKLPPVVCQGIYYLIILFVLSPVVLVFLLQRVHFNQVFSTLSSPLLLTAFAALLATLVAVIFAVINRLALPDMLSSFNRRSMFFLIALFLMTLIPPIVTLILSFKWMQIVGYSSGNTIYTAWIAGHVFLAFPLLTGFLVTAHFRLKNQEITYLQVHRTSFSEQLKTLFLYPFAADYLLTFILALSLIWNESTVNNVLADVVPSFVAELNKTITGKEVDYANGMNYLIVSLVLAIVSVLLWNTIITRGQKQQRI
jgi:ABC-type sugar transport system permease subunit